MSDIKDVEQLTKLLIDNKLDRLKFGDIEIVKSRHDFVRPIVESKSLPTSQDVTDPDEILYWSTSSPALTQEQINELAFTTAQDLAKPKRHRKSNKDS